MGRMDDYLNCNNKIRIKFRHHKKYQKYRPHPSDINVPSSQKKKKWGAIFYKEYQFSEMWEVGIASSQENEEAIYCSC